jgi:phosphoglycerol transferase
MLNKNSLKYCLMALLLWIVMYFWLPMNELVKISKLGLFALIVLTNWRILLSHWQRSVLYFFGFSLVGLMFWTRRYIGESNADQMLSTIAFGVDGVLAVSWHLLSPLLKWIIVFPILCTLFFLHIFKHSLWVKKFLPSAFIILGLFLVGKKYDVSGLIRVIFHKSDNSVDIFAQHYKNPASEKFNISSKPKSLILIYVESLESTYQNPNLFGHNLLAELNKHKRPGISFQKFIQTPGADWTIGGVVASQCGIPLKLITIFESNHFGETLNHFLPSATCLSDVLKSKGYHNVFLKGSALSFAGFNSFLQTHHYDEFYGKSEWLEQGFSEQDMIGWGLPDDLLFQQAKLKLKQLIQRQQLFNLNILTVDMHGLDGQLNKTCYARGARNFADIVECTAYEISDFINYVQEQGWMDKVVIVVTGDHLAMENSVSDKLSSSSSRHIFNKIISQDALAKTRDTIIHEDLFPTILTALGLSWSDDRLALGYSAIMPGKTGDSAKRLQLIAQMVASRSPYYYSLWKKN